MGDSFTAAERGTLARALARGESGTPPCPRCGTPLARRPIPPRPDVAYVRDRVWLLCPACGAGAVLDRAEIARAGREGGAGG